LNDRVMLSYIKKGYEEI